jgi:hypothetical protein
MAIGEIAKDEPTTGSTGSTRDKRRFPVFPVLPVVELCALIDYRVAPGPAERIRYALRILRQSPGAP